MVRGVGFLPAVSAEERPRLLVAMGAFASVACAALVARTAGNTILLSRLGPSFLTTMYTAAAIAILLASFGVGWLAARKDAAQTLLAGTAALVVFTLLV